jgi:hypothetical protein
MSGKLSLKSRKNLKENDEKKSAALKRIEAATGKSGIEFTMDEIAIDADLNSNGYDNRIGEVVYDSRLTILADKIEKFCADNLSKGALTTAWTSNTISFNLDENAEGYQTIAVVDGNLVMTCKPGNVWTNIDALANDLADKLTVSGGLSLESEKNLAENEPKLKEALASIEKATGKSGLELVFDKAAIDEALNKSGYDHRLGEIVYDSRMGILATFLTKFCSDEDNKEALLELWTSNKIRFEFQDDTPTYQNTKVDNGDFVMYCKPDNIWSNIDSIGNDLEEQL